MKKKIWAIGLLTLLLPSFALGAYLSYGDNVSEKRQEIRNNLYAGGGNITVSSVVFGDINAVGGTITIAENVSEDITLAGGNVTILGSAGEDVRVAGGNVTISKEVGGDLVVGAGTLNMLPQVLVKKDLLLGVGMGNIDGEIFGNAKIVGGDITLNGSIKGNVSVNATEKLKLGPDAKIYGNFAYSAPEEIEIPEGAVLGSVEFKELKTGENFKGGILALIGAFFIIKLLAFVFIALLLVFFLSSITKSATQKALNTPFKEFLRGFIISVAIPAGSIIALISLIGFVFGLGAMLVLGFLSILACALGGILVGTFLAQTFFKSEEVANWKHALWGVSILQIVGLVPFIGWILKFFVFLVALGAISYTLYQKISKETSEF